MRIHRLTVFISILTLSFLFILPLHAGINFPQKEYSFSITGTRHIQIQKYFSPIWELPEEFDTTIVNLLLTSLPKAFDTGNKKMISQWGKPALKGATKTVRVLYMKNFDPTHQQIVLSFIGFSTSQGFGDKYYDERIGLLTVLDTVSRLTIYPAINQYDKSPELTRIGFNEELRIKGQTAISVYFNLSNINPCCDTSNVKEETYIRYYILTPQELKECLTLLQDRIERFHRSKGADSSASYAASITFDKDPEENIRRIFSEYSRFSNDTLKETISEIYTWNNKRNIFEPMRGYR
jgi:hypothetical protein